MQNEQRQIQQQIKNSDGRIAKANREIAEEDKRLADLHGGSHARRRAEIDEKRGAVENLQQQLRQHPHDLKRLQDNQRAADKEMKDAGAERDDKRSEIARCEEHIKRLGRDRGDINKGYHQKLPDLLRAIENETSFKERPIGPVGYHVQLKEQKWSAVLEATFGATLDAFLVTSKADQSILQRLMQRIGW